MIFFGIRPLSEVIIERYPPDFQPCVRAYLSAIPPSSPLLLRCDLSPSPEKMVQTRRSHLIEQIVVLMGANTRKDAQAFSSSLPLQSEWEGMSDGPLSEAIFVDQWIEKHPQTAILPFLYLFKAHRLRAGYEAAKMAKDAHLSDTLSAQYHEALNLALDFLHPLISCIAKELDACPFVYLENQGRP